MLEELLTYKDCANCKICCKFEPDELIDAPTFTKEEMDNVINNIDSSIKFTKKGNIYQIELLPFNNKYICPLLKENGCILEEKKPFDCESWPFYVMKKEGKYIITISGDCPTFNRLNRDKINIFVEKKFISIAKKIIKESPDMITDYNRNMEIICELDDINN